MTIERISPTRKFSGNPRIPGDKSISHRGLLLGALAHGKSEVLDILESGDVQSTASCLKQLGVTITRSGRSTWIEGIGKTGFKNPTKILDCGNSGTTIRLLMGILSGQNVQATLTGDASLVKRPMKRVAEPLRLMGAEFSLTNTDYAPLTLQGARLRGIDYSLKVASAQIKSAILLAALSAEGKTTLRGEIKSRDHTERLIPHFGGKITVNNHALAPEVMVEGLQKLHSAQLQVPGDPSTAAFWLAGASLIENSDLNLENISLNPTRTGFIKVLERMGAKISTQATLSHPEPVGRIHVKSAHLRGTQVTRDEIPSLIDEIPMLAVLATQALGVTQVEGAEELRVKESDRLEAVAQGLRAMGAKIEVKPDGFIIEGPQTLRGAAIQSFHDHRIAMAFSIAGLIASGETTIHGADCVGISYPGFYSDLRTLTGHA